ncbi:hypothetical protein NGTWS0302_12040 [Mycolicibacterium cyprinidarum]|uniref:Type VII secretion protein EccE n=1 Tax=Mycolicibacterium cyprinidarum TaxID=2860311 RepID=A0ABQ4V6U5_9MYCO|nr:hypothetical protein NGTWS1702_09500 [Mycolicibacterium sp. NGTWSNA01]GJF14544.1 hypothetical protein NGTWS1803_27670 [Mycolicibacterium sp. NGTWS1803]GJF16582.1 hypothetical protein NGTWS0302_12040 [Mycolicibacterium sp. NGTWS0302]
MSVGNTDVAMELLNTAVVVGVTLLIAAAVLTWSLRRRAAFRSTLTQRGWQLSKHDEATTVIPATGDWTVTMTHSYAAQMSPPSTHVVTTVWSAPTPATPAAALIAGLAPRPELRELAAELLGSATPAMTHLLGIDQVSDGRPLRAVPSVDERLLVFATEGYGSPGALTDIADAVSAWCEAYPSEREQPVVSINDAGVAVRVRTDVLRSVEQLDAFVDLGKRCRSALGRSQA